MGIEDAAVARHEARLAARHADAAAVQVLRQRTLRIDHHEASLKKLLGHGFHRDPPHVNPRLGRGVPEEVPDPLLEVLLAREEKPAVREREEGRVPQPRLDRRPPVVPVVQPPVLRVPEHRVVPLHHERRRPQRRPEVPVQHLVRRQREHRVVQVHEQHEVQRVRDEPQRVLHLRVQLRPVLARPQLRALAEQNRRPVPRRRRRRQHRTRPVHLTAAQRVEEVVEGEDVHALHAPPRLCAAAVRPDPRLPHEAAVDERGVHVSKVGVFFRRRWDRVRRICRSAVL
mmetsp:Transcript_50932/g.157168  ORF Transcript_50932/g.157168 Transcript_50932/m.157168 type:complete len:285 (+) Transcript_50932:341-1195(+)